MVGAGRQGSTLGTLWAKAGSQVMFSSRHPEIAQRDGEETVKWVNEQGGAGLATAKILPGAKLVRAFNAINYVKLAADAHRSNDPIGVPIAGDDANAIAVASGLIREIGFEPVLVGGLAMGKYLLPGTPLAGEHTPAEIRQIPVREPYLRRLLRTMGSACPSDGPNDRGFDSTARTGVWRDCLRPNPSLRSSMGFDDPHEIAHEENSMTKEEDNKAVVGRWFTDFWGKNVNLAVIDELAAPDMLLKYSLHEPRRGRDDIKAFMTDFRAAFSDLNFWGTADLIAEGDYVVGQWEGGGTHTGPAFKDFLIGGLPAATGRKMHFSGTTVLRVRDGKILEEIGLDDGVTALTQLGLVKLAA